MRNEQGLTLIELLAVLAIVGMLLTLLGGVLLNGFKTSDRNTTNQRLQQEANYITESIRNEYLKNDSSSITLKINNTNQTLHIDEKLISDGYRYCIQKDCPDEITIEIDRDESQEFTLLIQAEKNRSYKIKTTFSKLH